MLLVSSATHTKQQALWLQSLLERHTFDLSDADSTAVLNIIRSPSISCLPRFWVRKSHWADLGVVGLLVLLEGVLSIDNALVLGLLAKRLPKQQQPCALNYGLVLAFVFRFAAIGGELPVAMENREAAGRCVPGVHCRSTFLLVEAKVGLGELVTAEDGSLTLVDHTTRQPVSQEDELSELRDAFRRRSYGTPPSRIRVKSTPVFGQPLPSSGSRTSPLRWIRYSRPLRQVAPPGHPAGAVHPKLWVVICGGLLESS